jgi:hypothetical protein
MYGYASTEVVELEDVLSAQARCQSASHKPGYACSHEVRWCSTSTCDGSTVLWCDMRHRQYVEVNLLDSQGCRDCHRPITKCWRVRPV